MKPHYHALTAATITDDHLRLLVKHARKHTQVKWHAERALQAPHVRYYRSFCARTLNDLMETWPT